MQVGDLVKVEWKETNLLATAVIISVGYVQSGGGFYEILCNGKRLMMHSDFMSVIRDNKPFGKAKNESW